MSCCLSLLASEARLAGFGDPPGEFRRTFLDLLLIIAGGEPTLLSWSGSMFEYLMPLLVMPTYANTPARPDLGRGSVDRQIELGTARRALGHFGIRLQHGRCSSGSRYAVGVPVVGLERELAPRSQLACPVCFTLALMVAPEAACLIYSAYAALP